VNWNQRRSVARTVFTRLAYARLRAGGDNAPLNSLLYQAREKGG
jgi:hypothetical protein